MLSAAGGEAAIASDARSSRRASCNTAYSRRKALWSTTSAQRERARRRVGGLFRFPVRPQLRYRYELKWNTGLVHGCEVLIGCEQGSRMAQGIYDDQEIERLRRDPTSA